MAAAQAVTATELSTKTNRVWMVEAMTEEELLRCAGHPTPTIDGMYTHSPFLG